MRTKMDRSVMRGAARKAAAIAAGVGMLVSMTGVPVFAASASPVAGVSGEQADVDGLVGTVTVSGIQEKDKDSVTVKVYQIVDGVYKDGKLVKYVLMDPDNGKVAAIGGETRGQSAGQNDIITESEITAIAGNIRSGAFSADTGTELTKSTDGLTYTGSLEPGMYVVLVTGATDTVYNPAVVSVNLTDANADAGKDIQAGSVDLSRFFQTSDGTKDTEVYVKSTLSDMDKNITGSKKNEHAAEEDSAIDPGTNLLPKNDKAGKSKGDTVAFGDTVYFSLDSMTVPSFSADYKNPVYQITDSLDASSFDGIRGLHVDVNGNEASKNADYTLTEADGKTAFTSGTSKSFKIAFTRNFLDSHKADAKRPVVNVSYNSTLLTTAGLNYAENKNHAEVQYSNNPSDPSSFKTIEKNTYHYTFGIDAALDAQSGDNKTTDEITKVRKDGKNADGSTKYAPLAGAVFTLYSDKDCKNPVQRDGKDYTSTSDANGHFSYVGLDEGTYYIKETTAPKGYTLSPNEYQFLIQADLDPATGVMTKYTVTTKYKDTTVSNAEWTDVGQAQFTNDLTKVTTDEKTGDVTNSITADEKNATANIVDTKLQTLPSTGAAGTIGLTAIAAAGMAVFFAISTNEKKKKAKNQ